MKRILAIILTVFMLVSAVPVSSLAAISDLLTETFEHVSVQYSCSEEEFKEIISESTQSGASLEMFLSGVNLSTRGYYYTYLTDPLEKQVYDACYDNLSPTNLTTIITTSAMNGYIPLEKTDPSYATSEYAKALAEFDEKVVKAMWCYRYDNVEDCDSYTPYVRWKAGFSTDGQGKIAQTELVLVLENHPYYSSNHISQRDARIKEVADIAGSKPTTYEKLKAIHDEIILNAEYDHSDYTDDPDYTNTRNFYYSHSSLGVLIEGLGVCESYAKAFKIICDYMGITTTVCVLSETHMWNIVLINDEWYCVDATWDDAGGTRVFDDFFLCGDPDIVDGALTDHVPKIYYAQAPEYALKKLLPTDCIHEKVAIADVLPTCTSFGSTGGTKCKLCDKILEQPTVVAKKAHNTVYVPAVEATCEADGNKAHYVCIACESLFLDSAGTNQVTLDSVTQSKKSHIMTFVPRVEATQFIPGNIAHYKCDYCSGLFSDYAGENRLTKDDITIDKLCSHEHCTEIPAIPATVQNSGYTKGLWCDDCNSYVTTPAVIPRIASIKVSKDKYNYTGKVIKPDVVVTDELGQTVPSSSYTLKYSSGLKLPGTYSVTVTFSGNYSGTHKCNFKIVIPAPAPKASSSISTIKLSWNGVSGASGYMVYDSNKRLIKNCGNITTFTTGGLESATQYTYYVRTYLKIFGKVFYSDYVTVTAVTSLSTPKASARSSASAVRLSWSEVSGATGYLVYDSNKQLIKNCGNKTSLTISNLKPGAAYSYYVRAYVTSNGKKYYSAYTDINCATKPKFSDNSITVVIGTPKALALNTTDKAVWSTSNKKIAEVDSSGVVTGKKAGMVTITAVVNGQKATVTVRVEKVSISLNNTGITLAPKWSFILEATTTHDVQVDWESSNPNVAIVENGIITGVSEGAATITACFVYDGVTYSATCEVTVEIPTYSELGYDELPDLAGAVGGGLKPKNIYERTNETECLYSYADLNWNGEYDQAVELYRDYLKMKGFSYVTTNSGSQGSWTYTAERYQKTTTRTRIMFILWSDGDVSIVMFHY